METKVDPVFYFNTYSHVTCLSFCALPVAEHDGEHTVLIIGDADGKLSQWDLKSKKLEKDIDFGMKETKHPILWLCVIKTDNKISLVIQQRFSNTICLLEYTTGCWFQKNSITINKHMGFCRGDNCLDSELLFPSGENGFLVVKYDKPQLQLKVATSVMETKGSGTITALKFCDINNKYLILSLFENGDIYGNRVLKSSNQYSIVSLCKLHCLPMTPLCVQFDNKKCQGIIGGSENNVISFELNENGDSFVFRALKTRSITTKGISSIVIRPDQKIVAAGSWDSTVKLFSWLKTDKLKPLGALKFHSEGVESVVSTNDSKLIAAGSKDGKVSFWNVY